jgi:hypothetical protein
MASNDELDLESLSAKITSPASCDAASKLFTATPEELASTFHADSGRRVEGTLFGWFETGHEGTVWALLVDNEPRYENLFLIEDGDHLVISSPSKEILFSGYILKDTEIGKAARPFSGVLQPKAKGYWIHWTQKGFTPDDWAALFLDETNTGVLMKSRKSK